MSLASPGPPKCQNSGMFQSTRAPTLTGQVTLAVFQPALAAASHSVGTLMSSAYQNQLRSPARVGSNTVFAWMPWVAGHTPVSSVVWLGYVVVGTTPTTPSANAPSFRKRRRAGILRPWVSAAVT